jgi:hypothetical protein
MNFRKLTDNEAFITKKDLEMLSVMSSDYKFISVGMKCDIIESSKKWPFRPHNVIFGEPHDESNGGWGKVKDLLSTLNVVGYHGHNYMQIELNIFTPCIYKYVDGEWYYHLHPSVIEKTSSRYGL